MASDCNNHSVGPVHILHRLVYCEMPLLRPVLLLRMLLLPEVLWELLRLLRYAEKAQAEVPRRPIRPSHRSSRLPLGTRHECGSNTTCAHKGCRSATVCDFRRVQEGRRRGLAASDADLGSFGKQEVRGGGGGCRVAEHQEAREQPKPALAEWNVTSSHTWPHHSCRADRQKSLRTTGTTGRSQRLYGCRPGCGCIWTARACLQPHAQWLRSVASLIPHGAKLGCDGRPGLWTDARTIADGIRI